MDCDMGLGLKIGYQHGPEFIDYVSFVLGLILLQFLLMAYKEILVACLGEKK